MSGLTDRRLRTAALAIAAVGLIIAAYLFVLHTLGKLPPCLAHSHGCETVALSPYSHLAGVPVSLIGMVGYLLLIGSAFGRTFVWRAAGFVLALGAAGFSLWLTYLEVHVIHAICQWCVSSMICSVCLLIVHSIWTARSMGELDEPT